MSTEFNTTHVHDTDTLYILTFHRGILLHNNDNNYVFRVVLSIVTCKHFRIHKLCFFINAMLITRVTEHFLGG